MSRMLRRAGQWSAYIAVRIVLCVVQTLSMETCVWWCHWLAWLLGDVLGVRRKVVAENLDLCFPEKTPAERRRIAQQMWEHLFLMVCELGHLQRKMHPTNWTKFVDLEARRCLVGCLLDSRPTVIISGHFGNFELGCYLVGLLGFRGYGIARPLDNPYLDRYLRKFRESKGQYILDKDGCAQQVADLLAAGETLVLLGDQFAGAKGLWVDFFGRPAACHKGIALFTLTSGAPMVVLGVARQGRPMRYAIEVSGHADPRSLPPELSHMKGLTRWYNERLEQIIRRYPEQYWWLHRRWKGQPPVRGKAKREAQATPEAQAPAAPALAEPAAARDRAAA